MAVRARKAAARPGSKRRATVAKKGAQRRPVATTRTAKTPARADTPKAVHSRLRSVAEGLNTRRLQEFDAVHFHVDYVHFPWSRRMPAMLRQASSCVSCRVVPI